MKPTLDYDRSSIHERKASLLLARIIEIVEAQRELLLARLIPKSTTPQIKTTQRHLLVADAFTNPSYIHYALKTTLAIFIAYITYNMLNWPGIRTCMITCFFVSLGTFDETIQKMNLRLSGALIGGGLGLATIIYIMPYLTTILGLSLMIATISFFAAWVATSSEHLSYAGLQIALAFFLCVLVGYGPTIDLTEARDRVVGVLLGNMIIFIVYTLIWPTTALEQAKFSLSVALVKLSQMIALTPQTVHEERFQRDTLFFAFSDAIFRTKRYISFESLKPKAIKVEQNAVQAVCGPIMILVEQSYAMPLSPTLTNGLKDYCHLLSLWLSDAAEQLKNERGSLIVLPKTASLIQSFEQAAAKNCDDHWLLACSDWYRTLDERLHKLEGLIHQTALSFKPINQAIKEAQ